MKEQCIQTDEEPTLPPFVQPGDLIPIIEKLNKLKESIIVHDNLMESLSTAADVVALEDKVTQYLTSLSKNFSIIDTKLSVVSKDVLEHFEKKFTERTEYLEKKFEERNKEMIKIVVEDMRASFMANMTDLIHEKFISFRAIV